MAQLAARVTPLRGRLASLGAALGLARPLCTSAASWHTHSHGGVPCSGHGHSHAHEEEHGHSHGPPPPDERGTMPEAEEEETVVPPAEPPAEDSGLPLVQRAKNILAANWRAQLSTIALKLGNTKQPQRPAVHGSLAPFALLSGGEAVVFLAESDTHVQARALELRARCVQETCWCHSHALTPRPAPHRRTWRRTTWPRSRVRCASAGWCTVRTALRQLHHLAQSATRTQPRSRHCCAAQTDAPSCRA